MNKTLIFFKIASSPFNTINLVSFSLVKPLLKLLIWGDTVPSYLLQPSWLELEKTLTASLQRSKTSQPPPSVLDLMMRLQSKSFGDFGVPIYWHYSQVHSELLIPVRVPSELLIPVRVPSELFNHLTVYKQITGIELN